MKTTKKRKNSLKKWVGKLHLWLGLGSGLIVFIVAVTGCIFVFHDEIEDLTRDWRKVEAEDRNFVAPSLLQEKVKQQFPQASTDFVLYQGRDRSAYVNSFIEGTPYNFYFNPYSGEFLHRQNLERDFFLLVEDLHMHLWLPEKIGKQVVGISTIIFVLMLISGIMLWWPKKKKSLGKKLKIKWNARWRRINYDWHSVTGLYVSGLALIIAVTGLSFSYEWVHEGMYVLGNLGEDHPEDKVAPVIEKVAAEDNKLQPVDRALAETFEAIPDSEMYFVWEQGENSAIITGVYPEALDFDHQSNFYFHPQSGELLQQHFYNDKSAGMKLQEMNYGLHTGQYFGFGGKILAFFASLFVAALPVSGFVIWWGRKFRKTKPCPTKARLFEKEEQEVYS